MFTNDKMNQLLFHSTEPLGGCSAVTVDPGLGGTGYAFWASLSRQPLRARSKPTPPDMSGVFESTGNWLHKMDEISSKFRTFINAGPSPQYVIMEFPHLWASSAKSHASAASGDLFKLATLVGALMAVAYEVKATVVLVTENEWKGTLPKDVVKERIKKLLGLRVKPKEHAADAIGIGLAIQGCLSTDKQRKASKRKKGTHGK